MNIFLRWANHLLEWIDASKKYKNIYLVNYKDLNLDFNSTINEILSFLEIPVNKIVKPPKNNYIDTVQIDLSKSDYEEFYKYIEDSLSKFPELEKIIRKN
jgi:hypothetical protein